MPQPIPPSPPWPEVPPIGYTRRVKDDTKGILACEYVYATNESGQNVLTTIVYFNDSDRNGWAYFFNSKQVPWARCAVPGNPKFDPNAMTWEKLKTDGSGYDVFRDESGNPKFRGFCPSPKDGVSAIPNLQLPPK